MGCHQVTISLKKKNVSGIGFLKCSIKNHLQHQFPLRDQLVKHIQGIMGEKRNYLKAKCGIIPHIYKIYFITINNVIVKVRYPSVVSQN